MEDVNKQRRILFRSLKLSALLKKSTPGKFAYICHFQQIGINATVFEKREFILKLTFSLPLPSSMLKLPINEKARSARGARGVLGRRSFVFLLPIISRSCSGHVSRVPSPEYVVRFPPLNR